MVFHSFFAYAKSFDLSRMTTTCGPLPVIHNVLSYTALQGLSRYFRLNHTNEDSFWRCMRDL